MLGRNGIKVLDDGTAVRSRCRVHLTLNLSVVLQAFTGSVQLDFLAVGAVRSLEERDFGWFPRAAARSLLVKGRPAQGRSSKESLRCA